ncbi:phage tail tape measure protein [Parasutterella sp.]|uniref:phage tail tape measure protein n=1 Tax=Parasutterella sp. TaxID=2049037 RepID=UPI003520E8E4
MGTKTYELMFQVAASMNQKFSSVFKKAANLTKIAEERVDSFNKTSSKIDGLNRQIEATKKLSAQYFRQKASLDNLRSAMLRTNAPSAVMKTAAARLTKEVATSKIKLDAEVRSLANLRKELGVTGLSIQQLSQKQAYLSKKATEYSKIISKNNTIKKIKGLQNSLRENGVGSMVALSTIGTEVARFTAMPVKQAMQMEDAMAEIRKVVDFSTPDGLKNMQKALEEMSLTIPITADGLAQITAAAGQAGIKQA